MADEQCDFDTLAAMLETDEENTVTEKEEKCPNENHGATKDESSDDDIDDDELDKLAALIDDEPIEGHTIKPSTSPGDTKENSENLNADEKVTESNSLPSKSTENFDDKENKEDNAHCSDENDDEVDSDEDMLSAQMKLMQEQMKLLAKKMSQRKKKKGSTPPKKNSTPPKKNSTNGEVQDNSSKNMSYPVTPIAKSKLNCDKPNVNTCTTGTPKVKTYKEINIFDVMTNDKREIVNTTKKNVNQEEQQPWSRKKSCPAPNLSGNVPKDVPKSNTVLDKKTNQKLKATVEKITSKVTSCITSSNVTSPAVVQSNSSKTKAVDASSSAAMESELFGDDSGSDWEELDGEKNERLTKSGKEMHMLLNKEKGTDRVAHNPTYNQESLMQKKDSKWNSKPSFYGSAAQNCLPTQKKSLIEDEDCSKDAFSGIRIVKPLISALEMRSRMSTRKLLKLSQLYKRVNSSDVDSDWVTIGVIVSKSEPKMSSKNTQYSIWKLSDLDDCDKLVTLFLFGNVHKDLWKHTVGSVIGLLNPTHLKNSEKYQKKDPNEVSITVDNAQKLMLMGTSKDFGMCKSKTKAGRPCTNVINASKGEYCTYHVQAAYKKTSSKRSELQAGFTGVTPKSFEKKLFGKTGTTVMYGGQSFTTAGAVTGTAKAKNQISLNALKHHTVKQAGSGKVNTLKVYNLVPEGDEQKVNDFSLETLEEKERLRVEKQAEKHKAFHSLLSTPTLGASNFVKHLAKKENMIPAGDKNDKKQTLFVSPAEFLKNAERERREKKTKQKQLEIQKRLGITMSPIESGKAPVLTMPTLSAKEAIQKLPSLGKGMSAGMHVDLDFGGPPLLPTRLRNDRNKEISKKKAIQKIQAAGGLKKKDPNAIKSLRSPETQEKLKRKLDESNEEKEETLTPAKKRSRLIGGLDLDDPEVQKVLNAKSSHAAAVTEEELEQQEQYFDVLEKKEAMEQKMASVFQVNCKSASCKQCNYTAFSASQFCKDQGHKIKYKDAVKKFFMCKTCKSRTVTLDRIPQHTCKNCGSSNYEKTSMLKEKKGPMLPGEELLLRGEERKYVNS